MICVLVLLMYVSVLSMFSETSVKILCEVPVLRRLFIRVEAPLFEVGFLSVKRFLCCLVL